MRRVPGAASAHLLIGRGLSRDEALAGLMREMTISVFEAESASDYAVAKIDASDPSRLRAAIGTPVS